MLHAWAAVFFFFFHLYRGLQTCWQQHIELHLNDTGFNMGITKSALVAFFVCVCRKGCRMGLSFHLFFCQNRSKRKTYETYGTWTLFNIAQMRAETRREAASVCTHRNRNALNLSGNHMNIVFSFLFWGGLGVTGCWSAYFAQYSNHAVITSWNEHCVISASTGNHREHILTGIAARSRCWAKWMHWQWHVNYTSEI